MKKKAALHNLGCKVNAYETDAMRQMLEQAGYEIVPFAPGADVYVINTCTVTNIADRKSRQMLHKAKKMNPRAIVVAAGCYVQASADRQEIDTSIDIVIGNNKKKDLVEILAEYERSHAEEFIIDVNHTQEYEELSISHTSEHTRAYIKVQDGCNQFCSYCIIPYARGRVRSRSMEDVIEEVCSLAANGYQEVVLTGIHLSSYGIDLDTTLTELILAVHEVDGIQRIRLGSLEPRIVTEEFAQQLSQLPKLCPHFHLSLQSGCDATLQRMNRKYTCEQYAQGCELLRKYFDHPAITTDVIVGFPGETAEEFETTRTFLEQIGFFEIHIFKYSLRKGTRAAQMPQQVPEDVKHARSEQLFSDQAPRNEAFLNWYLGKEVQVLLEEKVSFGETEYLVGYTKEYVKAAVLATGELCINSENKLITARVVSKLKDDIFLLEDVSEEK